MKNKVKIFTLVYFFFLKVRFDVIIKIMRILGGSINLLEILINI